MLDFLGNLKRTHYCGALRSTDAGRDATVMGWVAKRRDLGNLLFLDVRDRSGIVQVVFNKETQPEAHAKAEQARSEFVVAVEGKITLRGKPNRELPTGEVEVVAARPLSFAFFAAYAPYAAKAALAIPSVAYATGFATSGSSFWVLTTAARGWVEVIVAAYCRPSTSPGSMFGSMNRD